MTFFKIVEENGRKGIIVKPEYVLLDNDSDLMTRGGKFYAIWNGNTWTENETEVVRIIDPAIARYISEKETDNKEVTYIPKYLNSFRNRSTAGWSDYSAFIRARPQNFKLLDQVLTFASETRTKKDYTSKRLPYDLVDGDTTNYDRLMSVLFEPDERRKLEWAVGSILTGDSKKNQKFIVIYGEAGTGKSTFLNIVEQLFVGYVTTFNARALGRGDTFATSVFKSGPLVAIEHDGDLSRVIDNTRLNSIISHEPIYVNDKYEQQYVLRLNTFIFLGTNKPVQITDAKSGLIRRLIDVYPSGKKLDELEYHNIVNSIPSEIPFIAKKCYDVYTKLGRFYYDQYKPTGMMSETDTVYNFVDENGFEFAREGQVTLQRAYSMYKAYVEESGLKFILPKYKFKAELRSYFTDFFVRSKDVNKKDVYNLYVGFRRDKFDSKVWYRGGTSDISTGLVFEVQPSIFDEENKNAPAQLARPNGLPRSKWKNTQTTLSDIDTTKLHYVKPKKNHIVIDFDKKDENNEKSLALNIEAASKWPSTYAEISKSGQGVHLHYTYTGNVEELLRLYDVGVEVKVFTGDASLRRCLTKCTKTPIATIPNDYLPRRIKILNKNFAKSEMHIRNLIRKALDREVHSATKPNVDFIYKILDEAYNSKSFVYDITDLRQKILMFAMHSTNQRETCIDLVAKMKFKSSSELDDDLEIEKQEVDSKDIIFFDVEVFPNLFVVVYKRNGVGNPCHKMINPDGSMIEKLLNYRLVGFNNKAYDNHMLYARYIGYSNEDIFRLSDNMINKKDGGIRGFGPAYPLSYTDIYCFSTKRQSLKKHGIDLGLPHKELDIPWDKPVPEDRWEEVVAYCENDVILTEAVFNNRIQDYNARLFLSELSGLTPNDSTRKHIARIIFKGDANHKNEFVYTDLATLFPGYTFDVSRKPKSLYKGEDPSEGGYVYAEPGIHNNVGVFDITSMHPTSIVKLNLFGKYTQRFKDLIDARVYIKHGEFEKASEMLDGALRPYLKNEESRKLAYPIKIGLNTVYGLTKARFDNPFFDVRNVDNIVAKRGALYMIELKHAVVERGYKVVHIKTDSIKIVNPDDDIINFLNAHSKEYGYNFEHEHTYSKFCLINDSVYIAKIGWSEDNKEIDTWTATGAQFAHPFVFKTLFSLEQVTFDDLLETKQVTKGRIFINFNESDEVDNFVHVGKVGVFVPIKPGYGGGLLLSRSDRTGKYNHVTGTKGYRWKEASLVKELGIEHEIDMTYYAELVTKAKENIEKFGSFEELKN